jgi:hypothetical protein
MDRQRSSQLLTGIVVVTVGLIFLGDRFNLVSGLGFDRLWPVILIVLGTGMLLAPGDRRQWPGGAWVLLVGVLFLLQNFHVMTIAQSWPLFVVVVGLLIIFGRKPPSTPAKREL